MQTKRALITGMNGTVAPVVAAELQKKGWETVAWDRTRIPIDDYAQVENFILETKPNAFFHIGMGAPDWAAWIALICHSQGVPLVYTSTVSVYGEGQSGPFTPKIDPIPTDDYGNYKYACEGVVQRAHPTAVIARLGWQIGTAPGNNNMVDYFFREAKEGTLKLSENWYPGCSHLTETARVLVDFCLPQSGGLYHLDSNPGLSLYEIGCRLKETLQLPFHIAPIPEPVKNHLMNDHRPGMRPLW